MRKIFTYLTTLAAAVMLAAPVVSYAQEEEKPDVVMNKTVSGPDADGVYDLTLETYVTGKAIKTTEETRIPLEIVLVLDVSGSMEKAIFDGNVYSPKSRTSYSYRDISSSTYYYKDGDEYYEVKNERFVAGTYYNIYVRNSWYHWYLTGTSTSNSALKIYTDPNQTIWTGSLYSSKNTSSKLASKSYSYNDVTGTLYYYYSGALFDNNRWLSVTREAEDYNAYALYYEKDGVRYYLSGTSVTTERPTTALSEDQDSWTGVLYVYSKSTKPKIELLQKAVADFIGLIADDAEQHSVDHKISVVKFADKEYYESETYLGEGNHYGYYNYTEVVKHRVSLPSGENALVSAVNDLSPGEATAADCGMKKAYHILNQSSITSDRSKVVVMFTDGDPTHSSGFERDIAGNTIKNSKLLKDMGAQVYTIGVFDSDTENRTKYMNWVSSNYPKAVDWYTGGTRDEEGNYYQMSNGADLSSVFKSVAVEIIEGGASVTVTKEARIVDIVTKEFTVPAGVQAEDISIKVAAYIPELDTFSSELKNPSEEGVKAVIGEMTEEGTTRISVTGYPFSDHWCGEGCGTTGEKLVITVPIVPKEDALGGLDIPTNGPESGLYLPDSDEPVTTFPVPTVDLPISIIIKKVGLADGESAIFNIYTSGDSYATAIATLMLTGGEKTEAKISGLDPNNTYKVQESDWSWTYNPKGASAITTAEVTVNPFIFENEKQDTDVKNAEATVINKFEKITK